MAKKTINFILTGKLLEVFEQDCKDEFRSATDELRMILTKYLESKGIDVTED